jgi:hypothetical protein
VGEQALDPKDLLDRLRSEHQVLQWAPVAPDEMRPPIGPGRPDRSSLEYLHGHWALPEESDPSTGGRGPRARLVALFGRLTFRVLRTYLQDERLLLSHVVRTNEALAQRCEELSARLDQLGEDMIDRQVAEAANLAELALWLQRDPQGPGGARSTPEPAHD